jgi:S1-C subfamily serine protease
MRSGISLFAGLAVLLALASLAPADVVNLKNGTSVEGTVIKFGNQYRVKVADGTTKIINESDVVSVTKGNAAASSPGVAVTGSFNATKARADGVDAPILAVSIWEKFIDTNPSPTDLTAAKAELDKWQKLEKDNAERINGKWVGGEDRQKLLKEVAQLCAEARSQMENQTLQAIEKYEKVLKLYPNSFEANFALGYYYLRKGAFGGVGASSRVNTVEIDKAIKSLETAVKLRPNSPNALSNLGVGYRFRDRWQEAVEMTYRAAKAQDSKPIVENLVNTLVATPEGMKANNKKIRPIMEEAVILAQKYGIPPTGTRVYHYLPPEAPGSLRESDSRAADQGPPGIVGNGSGFVISPEGYILTNGHVVTDKNRMFRVRFDDGTEKQAEVVAVDTVYDVALLKVKADKPLPYLRLASTDRPNPGAQCLVLGYPVASLLDFHMQVTSGEISSVTDKPSDKYQVTLTANTTHGNSGGPIVDRSGNVVGVLSAGATAYNATYIMALSAGQVRLFLDRIKDKWDAKLQAGPVTYDPFDAEKLQVEARKATVMVLIIRGDGKDTSADEAD